MMTPESTDLCRCTHQHSAHYHYRGGSECALCDCTFWSPVRHKWHKPDEKDEAESGQPVHPADQDNETADSDAG